LLKVLTSEPVPKPVVFSQALAVFRPGPAKLRIFKEAVPKTEVLEQPKV
jgi:hypothetical protein